MKHCDILWKASHRDLVRHFLSLRGACTTFRENGLQIIAIKTPSSSRNPPRASVRPALRFATLTTSTSNKRRLPISGQSTTLKYSREIGYLPSFKQSLPPAALLSNRFCASIQIRQPTKIAETLICLSTWSDCFYTRPGRATRG